MQECLYLMSWRTGDKIRWRLHLFISGGNFRLQVRNFKGGEKPVKSSDWVIMWRSNMLNVKLMEVKCSRRFHLVG